MSDEREQSAERIENAATELFALHGFDAVGVRDIARLAEVPVSAINYYFGSKGALYRECTRKLSREYVAEARARLDAGASLSQVLEHYVDFAGRSSRLIKVWLDLQLSGDPDARAYADREIMGPIWQILCEALEADGDAGVERRLGMLSFIGAVVLGTVLTDDQLDSLIDAPGGEVRERWRREILDRFARPRILLGALGAAR